MPTQVQGLITPVYTAIVDVAATGEVLTEARLTDTAVALGNRIEFLRSLTPEAAASPEAFVIIREDWLGGIAEGSTRFLGSFPWTNIITTSGGQSVFQDDGTLKNPGGLVVSTPGTLGNEQFSWFIGPASTSTPLDFSTVESFTIVAKIATNNTILGVPVFRIGLADDADDTLGGADALGIQYNPQVSGANWLRLKRVAGVSSSVVLAPVVLGEYVVFKFERDATGINVYVDGVLFETILTAALPTGGCTFGGYQEVGSAAGATSMSTVVDFVSLRASIADRSGV